MMDFIPWTFAVIGASIVLFIVTGGIVAYALRRADARMKLLKKQMPGDELRERIEAIESRLNDIQDIVLAIDERLGKPVPSADV